MRRKIRKKFTRILLVVTVCFAASQSSAVEFASGTGQANDPYQIATAEQLRAIGDSTNYDKNFILIADIDLDPNLPGNEIIIDRSFIGYFGGILDGNSHSISNSVIEFYDVGRLGIRLHLGLIGSLGSNGIIKDIHLRNSTIRGVGDYVGGLVGSNSGKVLRCSVTGSISSALQAGGLVATNNGDIVSCSSICNVVQGESMAGGLVGENNGYIYNCHATGTVTGRGALGGLIGRNSGNISNCYVTCTVTGLACVGGLVGYNSFYSYISNCYAMCTITGNETVGGLIGNNYGDITNCYATGSVAGEKYVGGLIGKHVFYYITNPTVSQCYAACEIIADSNDSIGGLIGKSTGQTTDSFWDVQVSGQKISAGGIGLSSTKLQDPETYLNAGWDMTGETSNGVADIWTIAEPNTYPQLIRLTDQYHITQLAGSGTSDDPYKIATAEELVAINDYDINAHYALVADIDLSGMVWAAAPISLFNGTFDGRGHTISNLNIEGSNYLGLFGKILTNGVVTNLTIQDTYIIGNECVGALAGQSAGQITNCHVTGNVKGDSWVGGLVGIVYIPINADFEDYVSNCTADVALSGNDNVHNIANVYYVF